MLVRVYVRLKPGVLDPQGRAIARALAAEGFPEVRDATVGKLIELDVEPGGDVQARVKAMCEQLLANTVIERYQIELPEEAAR